MNNGYQSPATRLAARVQAVENTDEVQNAAIDEGGSGGLPPIFNDHVTGILRIISDTPIPLLRKDGGDPISLGPVPAQPAGTKLLVTVSGSANNGADDTDGGPSDQLYIQAVVNGVPVMIGEGEDETEDVASTFLSAGQPIRVGGEWTVELDPEAPSTTVTFLAWTASGHKVGCVPKHVELWFLRTRLKFTATLCS